MLPAILGLSGTELSAEERGFFAEVQPLGFILFARNIADKTQLRALTDSLRELTGRAALPILIDQEGGRVARLTPPEWNLWPPAQDFARAHRHNPELALRAALCNYQALALELAQVGVSVDCAPVLDVPVSGAHDIIGDRAYGGDPQVIADFGQTVRDGFQEAGLVSVIKHLPGHGRAGADSHETLPRVTASAEELARDLLPFQRHRTAPMAMTAHIVYDAWDPEHCATLSPSVIADIIRGSIDFDGLLMSDDLDMKALTGSIPERGLRAVQAGCDVALNCWGRMEDMQGLATLLPTASPDCHRRLEQAMATWRPCPDDAAQRQRSLVAERDRCLAACHR